MHAYNISIEMIEKKYINRQKGTSFLWYPRPSLEKITFVNNMAKYLFKILDLNIF